MMWLMAAALSLSCGEDQVGSGVPHFGLANQLRGYIMHTIHALHEAVFAPRPDLLTSVPAIASGHPPFWGFSHLA